MIALHKDDDGRLEGSSGKSRMPVSKGFLSFKLRVFLSLSLLIGLSSIPQSLSAQQGGLDWEDPTNISNSGGSINPNILAIGDEEYLAVWEGSSESDDSLVGVSLTTPDGWSRSAWVSLPFAGFDPTFKVSSNGIIHAFWIDDENVLRYNPARPSDYRTLQGWYSRQVGSGVVAFDVELDGQNGILVAFITGEDTVWGPAGLYFSQYIFARESWSTPNPIYLSNYFQQYLGLPEFDPNPINPEPAHPFVDIVVAFNEDVRTVYITWDNPALKRIFSISSLDPRITWDEVIEVQGPDEQNPYDAPRRLQIISNGGTLLRTWQILVSGGYCTQVYQSSTDDGTTWGQTKRVFPDLNGCPEDLQVFRYQDGAVILFATFLDQSYLVAWDGKEWSHPQNQQDLGYFVDPMTFNFIEFGCRTAELVGDRLLVVGCDLGEGSDIWFTQAQVGTIEDWFDAQNGWQEGGALPLESSNIDSLSLIADKEGRIHSLISHRSEIETGSLTSDIQYTGWQGSDVIGPFPIHTELPGFVRDISLTIESQEGLHAFWIGSQAGEVAYSHTSIDEAPSEEGWTEPEKLYTEGTPGRGPQLRWIGEQSFLVYAIPANEERGVYLSSSIDRGKTWQEPQVIFDGVASGCDYVEAPNLATTENGDLHVMWTCSTLPGGIGPLEIAYSRSHDYGESWSPAEAIVEGSVLSSQLISGAGQTLHLVWSDTLRDQYRTRHAFSHDGGLTWSKPKDITTGAETYTRTAAVADHTGQVHFVQVFGEEIGSPVLHYETWWNGSWSERADLPLRADRVEEISAIDAAIDSADRFIVAYAGPGTPDAAGDQVPELVYHSIEIDYPSVEETEVDPVAELDAPQTEVPDTQSPSADEETASIVSPFEGEGESTAANTSPINVVSLAFVLLSALIVVIVMAIRHRRLS